MTVSELKQILDEVDGKKKVVMSYSPYGSSYDINGYYLSQKEDDNNLYLSDLNVQPRV